MEDINNKGTDYIVKGKGRAEVIGLTQRLENTNVIYNNILTYLLTYLLTQWSRVLLEKLTDSAASQEIPRIFGTRRFLTVPTSARHLSLP